jgi:hypothetical protein
VREDQPLQDAHIHATFRHGKHTPLHRWYPYLEGYSPQFVEQVLARYAPDAARIFDPFGGVGTTPLLVAAKGWSGWYCELNPLLQYLIEGKIRGLLLADRDRARIPDRLSALSEDLPRQLSTAPPDRRLLEAYGAAFQGSAFFDTAVLDEVARARSWVDALAVESPALGHFAGIAAVASLIPASNLERAGDLRFRRGREVDQRQPFAGVLANRLRIIAEDLQQSDRISTAPVLLCGDARTIAALPSLDVDAVVTSPPYLNGTNYFRNTKVELWFLRSITSASDLAAFRHQAVTAGINDVAGGKPLSTHPSVARLVATLEREAYDPRIPKMVGSYFYDMECVLRGLTRHLAPRGMLALDIGDSVYAGVHVPTHTLLQDLAAAAGLMVEDSVVLRRRLSHDGSPLKQMLLVFRRRGAGATASKALAWRNERWDGFKRELPHQSAPFAKRNWGHPLHSLCSYQGKMKPSLAHWLVKTFVPAGGRMLDPFAGVGTLPFEAALQGRPSFGFDISPPAIAIATAKLGRPIAPAVDAVLAALQTHVAEYRVSAEDRRDAESIRFNSAIPDYFHPRTLAEVIAARRFFQVTPPTDAASNLVLAALLHVLHGNRPYALSRRSHPITPFAPAGPTEYRPLMKHVRDKVQRSLATPLPEGFAEGMVFPTDATGRWPADVNALDAVITSPPFFDSTRFYLANWMRLWFCGWGRVDFDSKPPAFVDERQKADFRVYEPIFRNARERMKNGAVFVLHLGRSAKCDMAAELARVSRPWFRVADQFTESVEHCESHGIRDKGTVKAHQFLVLR